jgi:hypothetical protein
MIFASFAPAQANAQQVCRWQVDGKWTAYQRNENTTVPINVNIRQTENFFGGSAFTSSVGSGRLNGNINNFDFVMVIEWQNGIRAAYNGTIHPQWNGNQQVIVLDGTSYDANNPFTRFQWWKSTLMYYRCTPH